MNTQKAAGETAHTITLTNQDTGEEVIITATKLCMGCGKVKCFEGDNEPLNALSRYEDVYICSDCGVREALEGVPYYRLSLQ